MSVNGNGLALQVPEDMVAALVDQVKARVLAELGEQRSTRWLRGNAAAAGYIDAPVSRVDALTSQRLIPFHKDGSANIFNTAELDEWLRSGGAKRW